MKILAMGDFQGEFPLKMEKRLKKEEFDFAIALGDFAGIRQWRPYFKALFIGRKKNGKRITPEEFFGKRAYKNLIKKDEKAGKEVFKKINALGKAVIFVFGNTDDGWYDYPFEDKNKANKSRKKFVARMQNMNDISYGRMSLFGIRFAGFGGYMDVKFNYGKPETKEEKESFRKGMKRIAKSKARLKRLLSKRADVLVLHYPPKGVFDVIKDRGNPYHGKSAGIRMFRDAIIKKKPRLVLCGHMHEYQGKRRIGGSLIVNPGDAARGKYAVIDWPSLKVRFVK
jgi:Icc-related predicted phosphoesterase